jgi:hypothetical protein
MFTLGGADAYLDSLPYSPEVDLPSGGGPSGAGLLRRAREHIGEKYVNVLVPKDDPDWHGPWDCAEFMSWLVYQETGRLYGCLDDNAPPGRADAYTGAWKTDVVRLRAFEPGEDAGGKERGGRAMHGARPAARKLMQGPEDEPALRQAGIDFLKAEGQDKGAHRRPARGGRSLRANRPKQFFAAAAAWLFRGFGFCCLVLNMFSFSRKSQCAGLECRLALSYVEAKKQEHGPKR